MAAGAWGALRSRLVGRLGSHDRILREAFRIVEARGDAEHLAALLGGAPPRAWARSWADEQHDPQRLWESPQHGAPDGRSPLMCALLATPRHLLVARLRGEPQALRRLAGNSARTLAGASARKALAAHLGDAPGNAARIALEEWRAWLAEVLLDVGGRDLATQRDQAGRTALHYCAWVGDARVAAALLQAGADAGALDGWSRSAAHVAAARGHAELARDLAARCPGSAAQRDAFGHSLADVLSLSAASRSAVEERCGLSWKELFNDFVALSRPVVVRGGCSGLPAMSSWAEPQRLAAKLGTATLSTGLVPYAPGCDAVTLPAFLASVGASSSLAGAKRPQAYAFDASVAGRRRELLADADLAPPSGWAEVASYVRQPQFGLGFAAAGAPMHVHHAALNALFVGSKRWFLLPPEASFWVQEASASWAVSTECDTLRSRGELLELRQHSGDLVFVPEGWGHATVLEEYSVGVGQEFIPLSSPSS